MKRGLYAIDSDNRYSYVGSYMIASTSSGSATTSHSTNTAPGTSGSPPIGADSWPSTVSVLETPERRRWRDSTGGRLSVDSGIGASDSLSSPPYHHQNTRHTVIWKIVKNWHKNFTIFGIFQQNDSTSSFKRGIPTFQKKISQGKIRLPLQNF